MKAYSLDLRERLVRAVQSGKNKAAVARLFEVSLSTVKRLFKRFTQTQELTPLPRSGRRPLISSTDYEKLGQQLRQNPDAGLAYHCQEWQHHRAVKVSRATLCRTLVRMKWSRKKNSLNAIERDEAKRENLPSRPAQA